MIENQIIEENKNFLGLYEENLDEILFDFCKYYASAKKVENSTKFTEELYENIKSVENYLNNELTNIQVWAQIYTNYKKFEHFGTYKSLPQSFGKLNEEYLYNLLKEEYPDSIIPFPNGEMNFPDITFNGLPMDFKAVKCEISGKSIKIKYSNAIDSVYEVSKNLMKYFYEGEDCDLANSFLIFTFYDEYEDFGKVRFLHFKIMPTLYCIQLTKDGRFALKSYGEADEDGNHYKIKNSNICVRIPTVDRTDEDTLKLPSIEEKLLMIRDAVDKEQWKEMFESIRRQRQEEIDAYGYPGQ